MLAERARQAYFVNPLTTVALVVSVAIVGLQLLGVSLTRSYEGTSSALSGLPEGVAPGAGTDGGGESAGGAAGNAREAAVARVVSESTSKEEL